MAARSVAVRLLAGLDITPEVKEFDLRYAVEAFPALYVSTRAIAEHRLDERSTARRIRLATQSLDAVADRPEEFLAGTILALAPLAAALSSEIDPDGEAQVRFAIATSHAQLHHCPEAKAEFDAVLRLAPQSPTAPKALLGAAAVAWYELDYAKCRALCQRVIGEYPRSPEAKAAKQTVRSCDERTGGK